MLRRLLRAHNVATTALLANYWKHEAKAKKNWGKLCQQPGTREKDLFKDDLMPHFIDDEIKKHATRLPEKMWMTLATRTRFFRKTISQSIKKDGIKQVIILGSGFDTLPARKKKYTTESGVQFFEVDQADHLACKAAIYKDALIDKNAEYLGMDYVQGNLIQELAQHGVDFTIPTFVLWEGNVFYLERTDVVKVLTDLQTHFTALTISFDYIHQSFQSDSTEKDEKAGQDAMAKTLTQFKENKSPFKTFFRPEEIVRLCHSLGFKTIAHRTAASLIEEYGVDKDPYYTSKEYSMLTVRK
jgi:methyltransferase (TIGR00027 family)